MITPTSSCFFIIELDSAAESVASILSPSIFGDIEKGYLISANYDNDIQASIDFNDSIDFIQSLAEPEIIVHSEDKLNSLYLPSTKEKLSSLFEETEDSNMKFTEMDGDLFSIQTKKIESIQGTYLKGRLTYVPFKLPSFEEITEAPQPFVN